MDAKMVNQLSQPIPASGSIYPTYPQSYFPSARRPSYQETGDPRLISYNPYDNQTPGYMGSFASAPEILLRRPKVPYPEYYDGRSYNPFDTKVSEDKDIVTKLLMDWTPAGEEQKGSTHRGEKKRSQSYDKFHGSSGNESDDSLLSMFVKMESSRPPKANDNSEGRTKRNKPRPAAYVTEEDPGPTEQPKAPTSRKGKQPVKGKMSDSSLHIQI